MSVNGYSNGMVQRENSERELEAESQRETHCLPQYEGSPDLEKQAETHEAS